MFIYYYKKQEIKNKYNNKKGMKYSDSNIHGCHKLHNVFGKNQLISMEFAWVYLDFLKWI